MHLRGRQFMVKDQQVRADLGGPEIDVRQSAPADQIFRIRLRTVLNLCVKDLHPAGGGQLPKFFQRGFCALQRIFSTRTSEWLFPPRQFAGFSAGGQTQTRLPAR